MSFTVPWDVHFLETYECRQTEWLWYQEMYSAGPKAPSEQALLYLKDKKKSNFIKMITKSKPYKYVEIQIATCIKISHQRGSTLWFMMHTVILIGYSIRSVFLVIHRNPIQKYFFNSSKEFLK